MLLIVRDTPVFLKISPLEKFISSEKSEWLEVLSRFRISGDRLSKNDISLNTMSRGFRIFSDKGTCANEIFKSAHYSKNYDRKAEFRGQRLDQLSKKNPFDCIILNHPCIHSLVRPVFGWINNRKVGSAFTKYIWVIL